MILNKITIILIIQYLLELFIDIHSLLRCEPYNWSRLYQNVLWRSLIRKFLFRLQPGWQQLPRPRENPPEMSVCDSYDPLPFS